MTKFFSALIFISSLTICSSLFAKDYFYCNKTITYIYPGDTLEHVKQSCGEPTGSTEEDAPLKTKVIDQWIYDYQPNSAFYTDKLKSKESGLVLDFVEDKLVKITVEGQTVDKSFYCRTDVAIQLGDHKTKAYQICPHPSKMHTITQTIPQKAKKQQVLTYQPNEYSEPTKLYFQDSKLVKID